MWEVRIALKLHKAYEDHDAAVAERARLIRQGAEDVEIIGTGSLSESAPVDVEALPYSMREAA